MGAGSSPPFSWRRLTVEQEIEDCRVYRLGRELARDLLTLPALSQSGTILLRRQSARSIALGPDRLCPAFGADGRWMRPWLPAASRTGGHPSSRRHWDALLRRAGDDPPSPRAGRDQGERLSARSLAGDDRGLPAARGSSCSRGMSRICWPTPTPSVPLCYLGRSRSTAGLGLYLAFTDRLTRNLLPGLFPAAARMCCEPATGTLLSPAVAAGRAAAKRCADMMVSAYDDAESSDRPREAARG
ncbi:MAG: hypothetical protein MZV70_73505 [Desulfobacterales bacterium]|nr:hypothetical protein [Desulfobacterales bacterium]